MIKTKYLCIEGTEGVGKTTQVNLLTKILRNKGYSVIATKEPGTPLVPLTMELRNIVLNNKYDNEITPIARELLTQAIRSIHLEKVILPAMGKYDYIIQDRGMLSALAYGTACGNSPDFIHSLMRHLLPEQQDIYHLYDTVIYMRGDSIAGLQRAINTKQEYIAGDVMESRGNDFISRVDREMLKYSELFSCVKVDVDGRSIEDIHSEIMSKVILSKELNYGKDF